MNRETPECVIIGLGGMPEGTTSHSLDAWMQALGWEFKAATQGVYTYRNGDVACEKGRLYTPHASLETLHPDLLADVAHITLNQESILHRDSNGNVDLCYGGEPTRLGLGKWSEVSAARAATLDAYTMHNGRYYAAVAA